MTEEITRQEFLRISFRFALRLFVVVAIAWVAICALKAIVGMDIEEWKSLGLLAAGVVVVTMVWKLGAYLYARLPAQGKAICDAMGKIAMVITLIGVGVLAWHHYRIGEYGKSILMTVLVLGGVVETAREVHKGQTTGKEPPADEGK